MTTPVLSKPRDPQWVHDVMQPGPNGHRFDGASTPWRGQATLPQGVIAMYDSTSVAAEPDGALAYAGYFNGTYENLAELRARFPNATIVSITPDGAHGAMYIDVEPYDAVPADVPAFIKAGGSGFYCSASSVQACIDACSAAGIPRDSYRIWSAHWIGQHICGPASCGYPAADGTQYLSTAGWDESAVASPQFFELPEPPPPPVVVIPAWQAAIFAKLPTLRTGAIDTPGRPPWVKQAQGLVSCTGPDGCDQDGDFGPQTLSAVRAAQAAFSLPPTGVVDELTWTVIATGGVSAVLPDVEQGSAAVVVVRRVQTLCCADGQAIAVDGSFGPKTIAAVRAIQGLYLAYDEVDGIVGPVTWALLLTHAHP